MPKFYFAEFTNSDTGEVFQKFGHTGHNDAMKRLDRIVEEFPQYKARVLAAAYHHKIEKCQGAEEAFQVMYPKNFWVEEKLSGITECVKLQSEVRNNIIKKVMTLNDKFKKECFGENRA
tara:strand:- start:4846 stop:5202 length:357 start_codon:yes stop_codon:yes gene_type:complete